ncbi:MAG: PQQ-binding-like beta-propeller repeat protein, partial [Planctomycetes bacterium]|nr:PQQ-binding-like beta-propeller repeat protein [Planctomycetota bacterium]
MKRNERSGPGGWKGLFIAAVALVLAGGGVCYGHDWPRWRGPEGTGYVPAGQPVPKTLPATPKVLWQKRVGFSLGSPVVAGGRVFYLDNQRGKETIHAAAADTGKELWQAVLDDVHRDFQSPPGPRGTCVVDGELLFAQSCRGELHCVRAADGKLLWRVNFVKDFGAEYHGERGQAAGASRHGYTGSPVVDGEHLIVGVGGRKGAGVVCFEKRTGKVVWKSQDDVPGCGGPIVATICGVRQVLSFTVPGVIGLRRSDGKLLWRVPVRTSLGRHVVTPVVVGRMVMVASYQAGLIGIRISRDAGGLLRAERAWVNRRAAFNFSSPVAVGGYIYGLGPGRRLFCVDVRTGETAWSAAGLYSGGKGYVSLLVMGENLLVLAENGQLLLIPADPKGFRVVAKTRV